MIVTRKQVRDSAHRWWRHYIRGTDERRTDPAVRAKLRRCRSTEEAMMIPAAIALARDLGVVRSVDDIEATKLGLALDLARVLARIRNDNRQHPMRTLGWSKFPSGSDADGDRPKLSELRFRRLLLTTVGEERLTAFARLAEQTQGETSVSEIAEGFWFWNDSEGRIKQRWAFEYYNAAQTAPLSIHADTPNTEEQVTP